MNSWKLATYAIDPITHYRTYNQIDLSIDADEIKLHNDRLCEWYSWQARCYTYLDYFNMLKQFLVQAPSLNPLIVKEKLLFYFNPILFGARENIDTWVTYLHHTYPNDDWSQKSSSPCLFKQFLSATYDNNFSYRLFYNLRNFIQHCGTPPYTIKKVHNKILLLLPIKEFVSLDKSMQSSFKKELLSLTEDTIELTSLLIEYESCLKALNDKFVNLLVCRNFKNILESCLYLYDKFHQYQDPLVLIQFIDSPTPSPEEITFNTYDLFNLESKQFISYYMKEFHHTGFYRPCTNNKFPLYQPSSEHPLIFDGIDTVYEQDATWVLLRKHFTLSTPTNYYALYYRLSENTTCNNILCDVFGQRFQSTLL